MGMPHTPYPSRCHAARLARVHVTWFDPRELPHCAVSMVGPLRGDGGARPLAKDATKTEYVRVVHIAYVGLSRFITGSVSTHTHAAAVGLTERRAAPSPPPRSHQASEPFTRCIGAGAHDPREASTNSRHPRSTSAIRQIRKHTPPHRSPLTATHPKRRLSRPHAAAPNPSPPPSLPPRQQPNAPSLGLHLHQHAAHPRRVPRALLVLARHVHQRRHNVPRRGLSRL